MDAEEGRQKAVLGLGESTKIPYMLFLGSTSLGQALAMSMLIFENGNLSRKKTQERKLGTTLDFLLKF